MDIRNLTLTEIQKLQSKRFKELVEFAGNIKHLSFMLNVPEPTVLNWSARNRISKEGANKVEAHKVLGDKFKAEYLRPDLLCK